PEGRAARNRGAPSRRHLSLAPAPTPQGGARGRARCRYLFLSPEHAARKYVGKVYDPEELRDGWHGWRATLMTDAIPLPSQAELRTANSYDNLDPSSPRTTHCLLWSDP